MPAQANLRHISRVLTGYFKSLNTDSDGVIQCIFKEPKRQLSLRLKKKKKEKNKTTYIKATVVG